jgi:predicted O-methyltransferase YrrM
MEVAKETGKDYGDDIARVAQIKSIKMTTLEINYVFTNSWFDRHKAVWSPLLIELGPARVLEVGSYEGNSTTYLIETLASHRNVEIHCIDSWEGGIEHKAGGSAEADMTEVEARFHHNVMVAQGGVSHEARIILHKGFSNTQLPKLLAEGKQGYFDFIYIDGSHQAPDVLLDAVLGFELLRTQGILVFDDYLWQEPLSSGVDPIRCPKMAIDAFTNIYCRKLKLISAPLGQLYMQKISQ